MKEKKGDSPLDPANSNPWKRYFIREFSTNFLFLIILIIPALVFYIVSVLAGLSTSIGIFLAFIFFIILVYLILKKELWNIIKR
jgi:hypothetical protein